jgi:NAD(P)-dependent dehydrogenase (short-subunit alcohol dehydrogenase family)
VATINFQQKIILVTGAASRSGYAIAEYLLKQGAELILTYHQNRDGVDKLRNLFPHSSILVEFLDLNSHTSILQLLDKVSKKFSSLDGLINTVGGYFEASVLKTSYEQWSEIFKNNLDSVFLMCRSFYPLLAQSASARIINFAYSNADRVVASRSPAYHIAKMGVISLSKSLAREWGGSSITVNVISPGTLQNSIVKDNETAGYIPVGRFGEYSDLWPLLDLIFREDSTYLTGNNFILSGGYNL